MKKLFILIGLLAGLQLSAQQPSTNKRMAEIADPSSDTHWVRFKAGQDLDPTMIFEEHKEAFNLSKDDRMDMFRSETDQMGFRHHRYQQYYKGVKVEGFQYIVHQDSDGKVFAANGETGEAITLDSQVKWTEQQSLAKALQSFRGKRFAWEDTDAEAKLKQKRNDPLATAYPKGELLIARTSDAKGLEYHLAWKFKVSVLPARESKYIYVDAHTGNIVKAASTVVECNPTSGPTTFNGTRNFATQQVPVIQGGQPVFRWGTRDDCGPGPECQVFNPATGQYHIRQQNNQWNDPGLNQIFWGLRQASNYFFNVHHRNSFDNQGASLVAHYPEPNNNASWEDSEHEMYFGDNFTTNTQNDDWHTLDLVGHELMHGMTQFSSDLEYKGESGALNESFSDIFGEMVERYATGSNDWLIANQRGEALRSFINPNAMGDPDTYAGTNWVNQNGCIPHTGNDDCGVHTNSGVQNYWFYLLSTGGFGTNDHGFQYKVNAIGIDAAAAVAYLTVSQYLYPSANYLAARQASINAAVQLFGGCAWQTNSVIAAWDAVGVYGNQYCGCFSRIFLAGDFTSPYNDVESGDWIHSVQRVNNGQTVFYDATSEVTLLPGFQAVAGANFTALIDGCGGSHFGGPGSDDRSTNAQPVDNPSQSESSGVLGVSITPNPFSLTTTITYTLPAAQAVDIQIFNTVGHLVAQPVRQQEQDAGQHEFTFDASDLPTGVYFLVMQTGGDKLTKRLVLTR